MCIVAVTCIFLVRFFASILFLHYCYSNFTYKSRLIILWYLKGLDLVASLLSYAALYLIPKDHDSRQFMEYLQYIQAAFCNVVQGLPWVPIFGQPILQ